MFSKSGLLCISGLLFLSACSSTESDNVTAQAELNDDDQVCEYTRVTGSNLKKKVCMTRREREVAREAAANEMNDVQRRMAHESSVKGF